MSCDFALLNKRVVATGKLQNYTRKELLATLGSHGALPTLQVSKKTDYLIVGSKPGGKLRRAQKLGVCLLSEPDLEEVLVHAGITTPMEYEQICLPNI